MVNSCAAYGCTNHNKMPNKPRFFRFPNKDLELRKKWIQACRRVNADGTPWNPKGPNVYLCDKHFISGKPEKKNPSHPDYIPSIFIFNEDHPKEKRGRKLRRYHSMTRRQDLKNKSGPIFPSQGMNVSEKATTHSTARIDDVDKTFPQDSEIHFESSTQDPETPVESMNTIQSEQQQQPSQITPMSKVSHEQLVLEINNLRKERDEAIESLKELQSRFLSYKNLMGKAESRFTYYTGIGKDKFDTLYQYMEQFLPDTCRSRLPFIDQLLMVLIKLRLDVQLQNLADQFNISTSTAGSIFKKWIDLLYHKLAFLIHWPDPDASRRTLPHVFRQYFPRLTAIIDCTEIFIYRRRNLKSRAQVYSNYKKHSTVKFLIACTPHGAISFISKAWGGRVSDVELVKESGFISNKYHLPGDQILADRGFTLVDEFAAGCGAELIIPAFTKGKRQLTAKEVEVSRQIASIRIHIERIIGLVKNRYKVLDGTISTTVIQSLSDQVSCSDVANIDKLFTVCCTLVSLGDSIVYNEKEDEEA